MDGNIYFVLIWIATFLIGFGLAFRSLFIVMLGFMTVIVYGVTLI